jgi:hypothetical protein
LLTKDYITFSKNIQIKERKTQNVINWPWPQSLVFVYCVSDFDLLNGTIMIMKNLYTRLSAAATNADGLRPYPGKTNRTQRQDSQKEGVLGGY